MYLVLKIAAITVSILVLIALGLLGFIRYKSTHVKDHKNLEASIDKKVMQFMEGGYSYGMVVGVVKNGTSYIKGFGTSESGTVICPDSNTIFELASSSKLFTTSILQIMADNGDLKLNDKILPILASKVSVAASAQNTTLLHLATHQSGFPSLPASFLSKMTNLDNPYKDLVVADLYDYLKTCIDKKPEGHFEYSNFGLGLLGHLMILKSGKDFEVLVKERLLNALGMKSTFITLDGSNSKNIIQGYDDLGVRAPIWTDHVLTGAGSFLSNATDMVKFIRANLNEEQSPVSASLLKTQTKVEGCKTGLGWMLPDSFDKLVGSENIVWHNGMAGGYASFIAVDRINNYGLVILSNKAVDVTTLGMKLVLATRTQSWKQ